MRRGADQERKSPKSPSAASKSRITFEAIKTCKRRSKCLREISPRLELSVIKIKVRFTSTF